MNRRLAFMAGGFSAYIFFENIIGWNAVSIAVFVAAVVGLATFLCIKKCAKTAICLFLGILIGLGYGLVYEKMDVRLPDNIEKEHHIQAYVTDYPSQSSRENRVTFTAEIRKLDAKSLEKPIRANISCIKSKINLKPGDIIVCKAYISLPENTPDFDAENYYKTKKLDVSAFANGEMLHYPCDGIPLRFLHKAVANRIKINMRTIFPGRASSFMTALLIGDKEGLSKTVTENMRITGLTHTVAVSGMHISFLVWIIIFIFGKRRAAFIAIPITLVFTFIAGCSPSIVRAFIMQAFVLTAPLIMRESDSLTALFAALAAILFNNPYAVGDVGLQLSFAATLGIIAISPLITEMLMKNNKHKSWTIAGKIKRAVVSTVTLTLSASIATIPIVAYYFKSLSLISLIANIFLIWFINLLFFICVALTILGFVYMPIAKWLGGIGIWLFDVTENAVAVLAKLPFAGVYAHTAYVVSAIAVLYVGATLIIWLYKKHSKVYKSAIVATLIMHGVLAVLPAALSKDANLRVTVFDVGRAQCIMAEYNGTNLVVDCGSNSYVNAGDEVYDKLLVKNTRTVDALIVTHFHEDHINGAETLLRKAIVKRMYIPRWRDENADMDKLISVANECGTQVFVTENDMNLNIGGVDVALYPSERNAEENNTCTAAVLGRNGFEVVVTGDLNEQGEKKLIKRVNLPDAEVYIAGHHGSNNSSCAELLRTIKPEYAVVSLGNRGYYTQLGFEITHRLKNAKARVLRTDTEGAITFVVDSENGNITDIIKSGGRNDG